jgi:hypothetical protein
MLVKPGGKDNMRVAGASLVTANDLGYDKLP